MLEDYKNIPFRENGDFAQEEQIPNEYFGSTVQLKMEEIASGFPLKEQEMIRPRTLEGEKMELLDKKQRIKRCGRFPNRNGNRYQKMKM